MRQWKILHYSVCRQLRPAAGGAATNQPGPLRRVALEAAAIENMGRPLRTITLV